MKGLVALALLIVLVSACSVAEGSDQDWVERWKKAQHERPRQIFSVARVTPPGEPGTPLKINGRLFRADGTTAARGVTIFAYQTDHYGRYDNAKDTSWRLRGWVRTDEDGKFTFITVRPGSYPGRRSPAHVHLTIEGPDIRRPMMRGLMFADDPFLSESDKDASAKEGRFGPIRPVEQQTDGSQSVHLQLRTSDGSTF